MSFRQVRNPLDGRILLGSILAFGLWLPVSAVSAQVLDERLVPSGHLRVSAWPSFTSWDERFGGDGEASQVSIGEDLAASSPVELFPGSSGFVQSIRDVAGLAEYTPGGGPVRGRVAQDVTRIDFAIDIGVREWWTVGLSVPRLKNRSEIDLVFEPDTVSGDLGVTPYITQRSAVGSFLDGLASASEAAANRAGTLCSMGDAGCASAEALADRAERISAGLAQAYRQAPLFPLAGSSIGGTLTDVVDALNADLVAVGLPALSGTVPLASTRASESDLRALPVLFAPLGFREPVDTRPGLWVWGDVELSTSVRLLEIPGHPSDGGVPALRVLGGLLVRVGTGNGLDPDVPFALTEGDGQTDVEARVSGYGTLGPLLSLRLGALWGTQGSRTLVRRIAPANEPFPLLVTRSAVSWDPGSYWSVEAEPTVRLADVVSLGLVYRYFDKGVDGFRITAEGSALPDGLDVSVLAAGTEVKRHEVGALLSYETVDRSRGTSVRPVRIYTRLLHAVDGSGGRVPASTRIEFGLSLFARIWG